MAAATSPTGPDSGDLSTSPSTFFVGDTITITANFADSQSGKVITFYKETSPGSGQYDSIGTKTASSNGNGSLTGYTINATQKVFARTSAGKETEVDTLTPKTALGRRRRDQCVRRPGRRRAQRSVPRRAVLVVGEAADRGTSRASRARRVTRGDTRGPRATRAMPGLQDRQDRRAPRGQGRHGAAGPAGPPGTVERSGHLHPGPARHSGEDGTRLSWIARTNDIAHRRRGLSEGSDGDDVEETAAGGRPVAGGRQGRHRRDPVVRDLHEIVP